MINYKDGYKYVDGVKIPKVRKTSMEFREKWIKIISKYSIRKCHYELGRILALEKHLDRTKAILANRKGSIAYTNSLSVENRFKVVLLKKRLTEPLNRYQEEMIK